MARYAQINKFAISLQHVKNEANDTVEFLHAGKHESLLQIDTKTVLIGMDKQCQISQNSKFAMSLQYLLKEVSDEVDFFDAGKHQSFLEVDFNTLDIKVFYKATGTIMKT